MWILLLCVAFTSLARIDARRFDALVSFGDSNSDTGNVFRMTNGSWPPSPPYFRGRLSDGILWSERLNMSNVSCYAYEGASTDDRIVQGWGVMDEQRVPSLRQQILDYANQMRDKHIDFNRTLFAIWAGLNDFYFDETLSPLTISTSLLNSTNDLLTFGVRHLLVFNQPPFQSYPFISLRNQSFHFDSFTNQLNAHLSAGLSALRPLHPQSSLIFFDLHSLITKILTNGSSDSFDQTIDPCVNLTKNGTILHQCLDVHRYVYFDDYHFTSHVHELIASELRRILFSSTAVIYWPSSSLILSCLVLLFIRRQSANHFPSAVVSP